MKSQTLKVLRPRQADAIIWLLNQMDKGREREVGFSGQPGFGKSIANQVICTSLHNWGQVRLTVTLAPQVLIEESLCPQEDILWTFPDDETPPVLVRAGDWLQLRDPDNGRDVLKVALRSGNPAYTHLVTTYQALTLWVASDPDFLPRNLRDVAFNFDEAHHVSENNQYGNLVRQIRERDPYRMFISATLYRHTGQILIDTTKRPVFTVSVADAMAEADDYRYCPKALDQRMRLVPAGPEPSLDRTHACVIDDLEREGWPKALIILKPGDAEGKADHLKEKVLSRNPGMRVFNMVGSDPQIREDAKELLAYERECKNYKDSKVDIILACGRFKEGDDWPMASHIYILWLTDSIPQLIQWFGRVLRSKKNIEGYPDGTGVHLYDWRERSVVTQIVARESSTYEEVREGHVDRTFLTSAVMADSKVAHDYLRDELRVRLEQKRERSGQENPEAWQTLAQAVNATVEETRQSLEFIAKAQASLALDDGFKPPEYTSGRIRAKLRTMRLTDEERQRTNRCLDMKIAQTLPGVAKGALQRMEKKFQGRSARNDWRWVHKALQSCFAQVAAAHDDCVIPDVASRGLALITKMTGWSAQGISRSLMKWLPWERTFARVQEFHDQHQHTMFDKSDSNQEYLAGWLDRQRAMYRKDQLLEDRHDKLVRLGVDLVRSWSDVDREAELIRQCLADPDWIPCIQDTQYGLGQFAWSLRINGPVTRQEKVREQVPWFEWDNDLAEFRRGLVDHGDDILVPGTAAYRWYEPFHVKYQTGTLPETFIKALEDTGRDPEYHTAYRQVWTERVGRLRAVSSFNLSTFQSIWDESHFEGSWDDTLLFRLNNDALMDFERESVFSDVAFQPLITVDLKGETMERYLRTYASEKDIRSDSLLGLWWKRLDETERDYYRIKRFHD